MYIVHVQLITQLHTYMPGNWYIIQVLAYPEHGFGWVTFQVLCNMRNAK